MSEKYKRNSLHAFDIKKTVMFSYNIDYRPQRMALCVQRKTSLLLVPNLILVASLRTSARRGMKDVPEFT